MSAEPRLPNIDVRIETPRLLLMAVTEAMLDADQRGSGLEELLGARLPAGWPPPYWDAQAISYLRTRVRRAPQFTGWCRYLAFKEESDGVPVVVGGCGCTDAPELGPDVEIGYSLLASFQGRGLATEAVQAFVSWIFTRPNVRSVCAQTYPQLASSISVLRRCGFVLDGTGRDPGTLLFRLRRPAC